MGIIKLDSVNSPKAMISNMVTRRNTYITPNSDKFQLRTNIHQRRTLALPLVSSSEAT